MITQIENMMYLMSDFFMAPVLILLILLFIYSLFAIGQCSAQALQRKQNLFHFSSFLGGDTSSAQKLQGYPLAALVQKAKINGKHISKDLLDVAALKELETVRNVSRLAPMLGLIATMIPMGPALKSLADGDVKGISENLIIAFSAVIFGLVIASVTFWIASVKKRWLAEELVAITDDNHQLIPFTRPISSDPEKQDAAA
ncbi:MotA/TolQ/ExbB proton channel family protein [Catenovulum sp. 2E275]|uniref:MotA/TolQ/ExbB proton channel family protein n=1 Tax=Catenovulum sp. 2E275 TaxID=2980497 RepID=UPI0021D35A9C|nr:MotA/TolQ/ExbB proton channel family protein [Catenovulum sp. 2E275]MCU4677491.1 MotA/TolQ/ExbB proton channel family protein [Catenovulum sp. 2E275]